MLKLLFFTSLMLISHAVSALTVVDAARQQIGVTTLYDGRYQPLSYPNGDVSIERGVCTDVIIRAFRRLGLDLQKSVHEDMLSAWQTYPKSWGLTRPDRNIDHRRVPNLAHYFTRQGWSVESANQTYQMGDIVTWILPGNLPHIGIISDKQVNGRPLIIHNIGAGVVEEDMLMHYPITGHFRPILP